MNGLDCAYVNWLVLTSDDCESPLGLVTLVFAITLDLQPYNQYGGQERLQELIF